MPMNETATTQHHVVRLSHGPCHYYLDGPDAAKPLLLIHGATVPHWEFDRLVPYLTDAGYRCIRFDLYGHGQSACPRAKHNYQLFLQQTGELLDHLRLHSPITVLGHSLGAMIAAKCLLQQPQRFNALIMLAPILNYFENNKSAALLRIPLLGEILTPSYVLPMLMRRRRKRYGPIEDGRWVQFFKQQIESDGFDRSFISLMRHRCLDRQHRCYIALQQAQQPVLLLRGSADSIMSAKQFQIIQQLLPRAQATQLADLEHAMLMTHPDIVANAIRVFLNP